MVFKDENHKVRKYQKRIEEDFSALKTISLKKTAGFYDSRV